jgi:tripartite ATP-independent transporter DctM subunit
MYNPNVAIAILCISFCGLLILRFPVALTLALSTLLTYWYMDMPVIVMAQQMIQGINSYSLLAIPFFILTGQILGEGGLANRIVSFTNVFVGRIPGGLSLVNNVACMFFGSLSGSAVADVSAIGSVMIPMMKRKGYSPEYSVGVTISSAIQGVVVPPSHNLVLYSIACSGIAGPLMLKYADRMPAGYADVQTSVTSLFMAGMLPGILLLLTLMTVGLIISIKNKYPKGDPVNRRDIPKLVFHGILSMSPALMILGSIVTGWATPTEAGAIAVVYSFLLAFFGYREMDFKHLWPVLVRTFRTVLMVFFLIAASSTFGNVMSHLHLPDIITDVFLAVSDKPWVILLMINILLIILGGPMDMAPMIVILTPVLLPVCAALGMHPVQFGIMLIFNAGMGLLTPPVGTVLFVGCAIGKVSVNAGTKAMMPFFIAMMVALLLITYIPSISMFIPVMFK